MFLALGEDCPLVGDSNHVVGDFDIFEEQWMFEAKVLHSWFLLFFCELINIEGWHKQWNSTEVGWTLLFIVLIYTNIGCTCINTTLMQVSLLTISLLMLQSSGSIQYMHFLVTITTTQLIVLNVLINIIRII